MTEKCTKYKKMTIKQLQEVYNRELSLFKNKKLLNSLPDKGKSLEETIKYIENEIKERNDLQKVEDDLSKLTVLDENLENKEKHIKYICKLEKQPTKESYKPFSTLSDTKNLHETKHTQFMPLHESIALQEEQASKLKEKQMDLKFKFESEGEESSDEEKLENIPLEPEDDL